MSTIAAKMSKLAVSDPRRVRVNQLRDEYKKAAREAQMYRHQYDGVFGEYEELESKVREIEGEFKAAVRELYADKKKGSYPFFDDDELSVNVTVKFGNPTLSPEKLTELLGADLCEKEGYVSYVPVVNHKALEKAVAEGIISDDELKEALVPGERQTPAVTIKVK